MKNNTIKSFIISAGRTGTEFFGKNLKLLNSNFYSIHEPDRISFTNIRRPELLNKFKYQGFWNLIIFKGLGLTGTRNISLKRINNLFSKDKVIKKINNERKWINLKNYNVYIESNWQLFGLIKDLISIYNSKVIIIFRDPREWVRSFMNWGYWYDSKDLLSKIDILGFKRISPKNVGIKNSNWKNYTRFQKLCWVWNFINSNFYNLLYESDCQNIRSYFFEDIFIKKNETIIRDFLHFTLDKYFKEHYVNQLFQLLQKKAGQSIKKDFSLWIEWDKKSCQDLNYFCGDLMQKLGYGNEPEWIEKIR